MSLRGIREPLANHSLESKVKSTLHLTCAKQHLGLEFQFYFIRVDKTVTYKASLSYVVSTILKCFTQLVHPGEKQSYFCTILLFVTAIYALQLIYFSICFFQYLYFLFSLLKIKTGVLINEEKPSLNKQLSHNY